MAQHHALRLAGRTGGVDDRREVLLVDQRRAIPEATLRPLVIATSDQLIECENTLASLSLDLHKVAQIRSPLLDLLADIDPSASAEDVIDAILQDVSEFAGTIEQYDDMTIVAVKKLEKNDAT